MKTPKYSEGNIFQILKEAEGGVAVPELYRKHGMSSASFYKWRSKYRGMDVSSMKRSKALEDKDRRMKKMYSESQMDAEILRDALAGKY